MKENTKGIIAFSILIILTILTIYTVFNITIWMPQNKHIEFINSDNLLMVYYKASKYESNLINQIEGLQTIIIYDKTGMSFEKAQNHIDKINVDMKSKTYKLILTSLTLKVKSKEYDIRNETWFNEKEISKIQEQDYVLYRLYYYIIEI